MERLQRAQLDRFNASTLRIIEHQATAAIDLDSRRALNLEQAVSGQHEFYYQVQVVHLFGTAIRIKGIVILKSTASQLSLTGQKDNRPLDKIDQ